MNVVFRDPASWKRGAYMNDGVVRPSKVLDAGEVWLCGIGDHRTEFPTTENPVREPRKYLCCPALRSTVPTLRNQDPYRVRLKHYRSV
jgi:hypothetical protein